MFSPTLFQFPVNIIVSINSFSVFENYLHKKCHENYE